MKDVTAAPDLPKDKLPGGLTAVEGVSDDSPGLAKRQAPRAVLLSPIEERIAAIYALA